ncbi:MAG: hypothetical protein ABSA15_04700 [Thermoplasmata archaeon]|jgi:hypothetical protein
MSEQRFSLRARISTNNPGAVRPVLDRIFPGGSVTPAEGGKEFWVECDMEGPSARELNRALLSALRRVEKRTRLRSEWSARGVTERFFDYVPKGRRTAAPDLPSPA